MGEITKLDQVTVTNLQRIPTRGGDILHGLKSNEVSFNGFGEAYFSWIESGEVKAWKKHLKMKMNLLVPSGLIKFVFHDQETNSFREISIGESNYCRITVPNEIWFGFQGITEKSSLLLNIASIPHDPTEIERVNKDQFDYNWNKEEHL